MASPPSYTDPSVADDISSLLGTVHVVRVTLLNAMKGLEGVDEINGVNLLCLRLRELDEACLHRVQFEFSQPTFAAIFQALE